MTRTFEHRFEPIHAAPFAGEVKLTVAEIESVGIKEILQSAGARMSTWAVLDALLESGESRFRFKEPLGVAREVKVAASGLFGRFVARAYLERYFNLSFFTHLGSGTLSLDGHQIVVRKKRGERGDLPDWVASSGGLNNVTVAEAKGCHDKPGPAKTLARAWEQAGRVEVVANNKRLPLRRIAVASRWASAWGGSAEPILAAHCETETGDIEGSEREAESAVGIARLHVADLLEPLGYPALAQALRKMNSRGRWGPTAEESRDAALAAFAQVKPKRIRAQDLPSRTAADALVGSILTRAGPVTPTDISAGIAETLHRLQLRPLFVGIERDLIRAVIDGEPSAVRKVSQRERSTPLSEITAGRDGTWLAPLSSNISVQND